MNARLRPAPEVHNPAPQAAATQLALLGTGTVGSAVLVRLASLAQANAPHLSLVYAANSRRCAGSRFGLAPSSTAQLLADDARQADLDGVARAFSGQGLRIVVDATASDDVAARHAEWLSRGIHVVTACKLGQGTSLPRWQT